MYNLWCSYDAVIGDVIMTSSPQVVGHMFAHPIVYDLVASSVEERSQAFELVDSIVGESQNRGSE